MSMRTRSIMSVLVATLLLGITVACGQNEPATSQPVSVLSMLVTQAASPGTPGTASTQATEASSPATPKDTLGLTNLFDPALAKQALDHVRETRIVRSGTPKVLLSQMGPAGVINQLLGQSFVNYSPLCDYRVGLVILTGDFDVAGYAPGFGDAGPALEKYVALVYDPGFGFSGIIASPDGSVFKHALNDLSLPDPPTPVASPVGTPATTPSATPVQHYWPCPAASKSTPTP